VKREEELYSYKRHLKTCQFFGAGSRVLRSDKCNCPFHADGVYRGERIRKSLRTGSRARAAQRLTELMRSIDARLDRASGGEFGPSSSGARMRTASEGVERFLASYGSLDPTKGFCGEIEYGTFRKYRNTLRLLTSFCESQGIIALSDLTLELLEDFRRTRNIGSVTWNVELQTLRTFFRYCVKHKWIVYNPANDLKAPRNFRPNEVVPYTRHEESRILAAAGQIGGGKYNRSGAAYEQLRARAMIMLLRTTALRVSDVCTLQKKAISWDGNTWRIRLRTLKSGEPVYLPIPENLKLILDALPLPRNGPQDCPNYFWNGQSSRRAVVGIAERTLAAVFKKSGVKNAHAHRFRHTLATRLLEQGATFEQVADILANSPAIVRKHYSKWRRGRCCLP
jgi:integrase/recombinase XerC